MSHTAVTTDRDAEGAVRSLRSLWDTAEATVADLADGDWSLPVPEGSVLDLVTHLAGLSYAGPDRLRTSLRAARARADVRLAARRPTGRVLAAECLDMCLHTHDLQHALGRGLDLRETEPAAVEACRLLLDVAPRLLVSVLGGRDTTVRLVVRRGPGGPPVLDRTIHLVDGHHAGPGPTVGTTDVPDVLDVDAVALPLLLAGRRDAEALRAQDLLAWTGPDADSFVTRARLLT